MGSTSLDFLQLGTEQAKMFLANDQAYCEVLVTCACPRKILTMAYGRLARTGKITPVEDMLLQEKEAAWEMAKKMAKGRLGRQGLVEVVKALLAIEFFINL